MGHYLKASYFLSLFRFTLSHRLNLQQCHHLTLYPYHFTTKAKQIGIWHFPQAIIPFPKANISKRVSRQRGKTAFLTSSLYKKKSTLEKNGEETDRKASVKLSANPESTFLHPRVSAKKWIHSACIVLSCRPTLKVQKAQ